MSSDRVSRTARVWVEAQLGGAVAPAGLEGEQVAAVGELLESVVCERRAGAAKRTRRPMRPRSPGAERELAVQVEAVHARKV
jgi:hypothetical protein